MENYKKFSDLCRTMKERTLEFINNPLSEDSGADTDTETDTTTAATDTTSAAADTTTAATDTTSAAADTTTAATAASADAVKEYENITNTSSDFYKYFLDLTLYYITYTEYYGVDTTKAVNVWQGSGEDSIGNFLRTSAKEANDFFGLHAPIKYYYKQPDNIYYQILITFLKNTEDYKIYYNETKSLSKLFMMYFEESNITGDLVMNPGDNSLKNTLQIIKYPVLTKPPPTPISNTEILMWINRSAPWQRVKYTVGALVHKKCWFGIDCNRNNPYHIDKFHRGVATPAAAERLRLRRTQRQQTGQTGSNIGPMRKEYSYITNRRKRTPYGGKRTRKKKRHQKKRTATSIKKRKRYRHARKKTKRKTKTKTKKR